MLRNSQLEHCCITFLILQHCLNLKIKLIKKISSLSFLGGECNKYNFSKWANIARIQLVDSFAYLQYCAKHFQTNKKTSDFYFKCIPNVYIISTFEDKIISSEVSGWILALISSIYIFSKANYQKPSKYSTS